MLLRNATVHPVSGPDLPRASVLVQDGKIVKVGEKVSAPRGVRVLDLKGLHVYPGLIDAATVLGLIEIGAVEVEGIELCEPCAYLADHLKRQFSITEVSAPKIVHGLAHRAGIRARILTNGNVRVGDRVMVD